MHLAIAAAIAVAGPAMADGPPPFPEFTFKMGKPPEPGAGKRITVQIKPGDQPLPRSRDTEEAAEEDESPGAASPASRYGWFWSGVSAGADTDPAARLARAFDRLGKGPEGARVAAPRMQLLQSIAARDGPDILRATIGTRVSPALALAVIGVESGGRADAVSSAGAVGLMQLIPATAERFGVSDSTDAVQNISGGVAYLDWLMKHFDGDPLMVLAAYNAGEGAVRRNGGVPPYAETRAYVPKVLAAWQVAAGLCATPPELVSDPCVFKVLAAGG